jgi:hypothetical protein
MMGHMPETTSLILGVGMEKENMILKVEYDFEQCAHIP